MTTSAVSDPYLLEERGWWAVYTKHQHERKIAEIIAAKGAEVFLPLCSSDRRRWDRTVTLALPLFPSYVFVRERTEVRLPVLSTAGVYSIVSRGCSYGVIPDAEIQNLRLALASDRTLEPHPFLRVGERVRVVRGALQNLEGILVRHKGLCRVVVSVQMLAQAAAVEVDITEISSVRSPARFTQLGAKALTSPIRSQA